MGRKVSAATLYKRSLKYADYILNDIIPYMKNIKNNLLDILMHIDNMDKDGWLSIKNYVLNIAELSKDDKGIMNPFNINKIKASKYKENHSSYYISVANNYAKYAVNKLNSEDEKNLYLASIHLYYYVICPEKI